VAGAVLAGAAPFAGLGLIRCRRTAVAVRVCEPCLEGGMAPTAGASAQVYGRGEAACGDPSVKGGPAQAGDPKHIAHTEEGRSGQFSMAAGGACW
jgi:hypothetical protein